MYVLSRSDGTENMPTCMQIKGSRNRSLEDQPKGFQLRPGNFWQDHANLVKKHGIIQLIMKLINYGIQTRMHFRWPLPDPKTSSDSSV